MGTGNAGPPAIPEVAMATERGDEDGVCSTEHAFYCCGVLESQLKGGDAPEPMFPDASYPLFVTWNTISPLPGGSPRLRGCIGTFSVTALAQGLAEYTLVSALEDSRFMPIQEDELPTLECGVSLLTDFEDAPTYLDWTIGIHGIYITFPNPYKSYPGRAYFRRRASERSKLTATYLPDVIPEQGWTKSEAVESAIRKAGWDGDIDNELLQSIKLRRYQSRKVAVSWAEYLEWKDRQRSDAADEHFEIF